MRKTKKFMALFLLLSLLLATGSFAYADTAGIGDGGKALIRTALAQIEPQKESFGYAELDFAALEVGEPIAAYDLVNESPIFSRNVYPLFQNDSLVLLGFEVNTGDGSYIQITSSLVDRINDLADFDEPVALLYDNANCYLCSAEGIHLLIAGESQNTGRSNLNFMTQEVVIASVAKTKLRPSVSLNYVSTAMASPRVQVYYSCNVNFVAQEPYENICWAATIACISNYVQGTNLSAAAVAQNCWNSTSPAVFNRGKGTQESVELMNSEYDLDYLYTASAPSDSVILESIQNGFPLFAGFENLSATNGSGSTQGHAGTIYGVHVMAGYLSVMDPINGAITAYYSSSAGQYQYVSPSSNNVFGLYSGGYQLL